MRRAFILPIILMITACTPAQPMPTVTPVPPTVTLTAAPTTTSTPEPTATTTVEPTFTVTVTPTIEPSPTITPDSLPESVKSLQVAEETGWKWENGQWEQHIVWTANGKIRFDTIEMDFSKYEQKPGGSFYRSPLGSSWKIGAQTEKGYVANLFEFLTNEVDMKAYLSYPLKNGVFVEIITNKGIYRSGNNNSKIFTRQAFYTDQTDRGKIEGGYVTLVLGLPGDEVVKEVKLARGIDEDLWVIFDTQELIGVAVK